MKKIIFFFIAVLYSLQFYSQNNSTIKEVEKKESPICVLEARNVVVPNYTLNTVRDLITEIQAKIPGFRATQVSVPNQIPLLTYRNCIINDVYVDGVRCDVSILQYLNPNDIEKIQILNSVMESDIYTSNLKI